MAGVLDQIRWPFSRKEALYGSCFVPADPRAQQLQEAKEILAEGFGVGISEVEEMIQNRMEETIWQHDVEKKLWPEMLWVEETDS